MDAARDFLGTNRNDLLAADLMTVYAQMRMTNEFRSFGIAYATNSPALLLEFADVYVLIAGFLDSHSPQLPPQSSLNSLNGYDNALAKGVELVYGTMSVGTYDPWRRLACLCKDFVL